MTIDEILEKYPYHSKAKFKRKSDSESCNPVDMSWLRGIKEIRENCASLIVDPITFQILKHAKANDWEQV